jgi:hypothetical protein
MGRMLFIVFMIMIVCSTFVVAGTTSSIRRDFYVQSGEEMVATNANAGVVSDEASAYDFFNSSDLAWIIGALIFVIILGSWIIYGKKKKRSQGVRKARRKSKK